MMFQFSRTKNPSMQVRKNGHLTNLRTLGGNLGGEINLNKLPNFKAMTMEVEYIKVWQAP